MSPRLVEPSDRMPLRILALDVARKFLGTRENPAGSNNGFWVGKFLREGAGINPPAPWCAAFVCYCYRTAGEALTFPNRASVGFFQQWMEREGITVNRPFRGDIVCYNFTSDSWPDHIGIVERVLALRWSGGRFVGYIQVIEGNTAPGNDANGGRVMRRYRWANRCQFGRIGG